MSAQKLRGLTEEEIEQLRRIKDSQISPLILRAVRRLIELHDEAGRLQYCLRLGRVPHELATQYNKIRTNSHNLNPEVAEVVVNWLFLEDKSHESEIGDHARSNEASRICPGSSAS